MQHKDQELLAQSWYTLLERFDYRLRRQVEAIVADNKVSLASYFYKQMMDDAQASLFLSNEQVRERLHPSMQRWLVSLFSLDSQQDIEGLVTQQEQIGKVHARVDIPVNLVLNGARHLKQRLGALCEERLDDLVESGRAAMYASDNIDIAMEIMSHAYSVANDRNNRTEEAYRLFSLTQSLGSEHQRQRAALLDWENNLLFAIASGQELKALPRLGKSDFGIWYHHKAAFAFEGTREIHHVSETIHAIDSHLLPALAAASRDEVLSCLTDIRDGTRLIRLLLDDLLERAAGLEAGRDALTKLLNRKFLPVVLNREIELARTANKRFAMLMVDIDHFKTINDSYGHEAGDHILQQVAALLDGAIRGGDYLFRLGGEEFMIVQVDTDLQGGRLFAERIRRQVEKEPFLAAADTLHDVTVSIGLALHDGHPDYQRTLRRADDALYQAKQQGRNRCVVAPIE